MRGVSAPSTSYKQKESQLAADMSNSAILGTWAGRAAVAIATLYALTFNTLPQVSGALTLALAGCVFLVAYTNVILAVKGQWPWLGLVCFMVFSTFINRLAGDEVNAEALFRYAVAILALSSFALIPSRRVHATISFSAIALLALALYSAAVGPTVAFAGTIRIAAFYGGEGAVHTSAITMVAITIIFWTSPWTVRRKLPLVLLSTGLLVGYGAATELLMLALFAWTRFARKRSRPLAWTFTGMVVMVPIAILYRDQNSVESASISSLGYGAIGSGRIDAWVERLNIFVTLNPMKQLLGGGPYSDYRVSPLWWWEPKSAHSDLLTILMEFGIIGLSIAVVILYRYWRRLPTGAQPVLISALLGMTLSNVLLDRPGTAVFWGMAIYCAVQEARRSAEVTMSSHPSPTKKL